MILIVLLLVSFAAY
ncbi:hypothetical protein MLK42_22445 [Escherichia coli]|nr:hypothetical protein [Escherichia coli]MCN9850427.1 hypothetical protein [Escherichia coli]MDS1644390.1 hypothetical protein [Escherichia coli]